MKKTLFTIIIIFVIILLVLIVKYVEIMNDIRQVQSDNREYTKYENTLITSNKLATLMNKAIDTNNKNKIPKDEKNRFIENNKNSIKIYLEYSGNTYYMEDLILSESGGSDKVTTLFRDMMFKIKKIEYHKSTGRISKIIFEGIEGNQ